MTFVKSETLVGMIHVKETNGTIQLSETKMTVVSLDDVKEANSASSSTMGFRFIYGRTADGKVLEFYRTGLWCKRDLNAIKSLGVIEAVTSWAFAPKVFKVPQGLAEITKSFELGGRETAEHMVTWAKALGMLG